MPNVSISVTHLSHRAVTCSGGWVAHTFLAGVFLAFLATAPSALGAAGFLALGFFAGVFLAFTTFFCDTKSLGINYHQQISLHSKVHQASCINAACKR